MEPNRTNNNENNYRVPTSEEIYNFAYGILHAPEVKFSDEEIARFQSIFD